MEKIFLSVLNMSLTGAFVIAAIMLARLPLKKAPKVISYALWAVAGFRLMFPFTLEGAFSLLPFNSTPIPHDIAMQAVPRIDSGITVLDNAVSAALPAATPAVNTNPLQIWLAAGCCIWIFGIAIMLIYSIASIALLNRRLRGAINVGDNIYEAVNLKTPFVMGLFRPKIYIPPELSGEERRYIVLHEQTHIRRRDHIIKMLAHFVLCLHWFNPLAWAAFILMGADMEMSCDERVMKELGGDIKNAYSLSLVRVASERKILNGSPLAFGEGGMKERVKNVLNFKKHSRIIIIAAVILVAVLSVGFAVNRTGDAQSQLQKITGATNEQAEQLELRLAECGVSYQTIAYSVNPITEGMGTDWQAYDLVTEDGFSYVLILRKSDNDFTAVLDNKGRIISGNIDSAVTPALYINGEYKFAEIILGGLDDQGGILIEDDRAIYVEGRKAVHMTIAGYEAWVAAGENAADVYDYAERVIYTPIGNDLDEQVYMRIDDYKAWAAAGENDADVYDYAVPYIGDGSDTAP
ncbi:MAG: M56 family metallopeptidase [Oscillospiraceae bacterium]